MPLEPIHTAAVGLGNLRFFRSPIEGPQQPWHSVEDLHRCVSLDRGLRRYMLSELYRSKDYSKDIRSIVTARGETTIAPHWIAQGFIGAMKDLGRADDGFEKAYMRGVMAAAVALTAGMPTLDAMNYSIAAYRNSNGIPGPHPTLGEKDIVRRPRR